MDDPQNALAIVFVAPVVFLLFLVTLWWWDEEGEDTIDWWKDKLGVLLCIILILGVSVYDWWERKRK